MHCYTVELKDVQPGRPFMMVNYPGIFIRIFCKSRIVIARKLDAAIPADHDFNDDGCHVPIVELSTGNMSYMAKIKPCMLYPGEGERY